jgi:hypothetical protein
MYRVLLKSMNLVCSGCQKETTHDGAAVKARDRKQNENLAWNRPYPIGLSSTMNPALEGTGFTALFKARDLLNSQYYLGIGRPRHNKAKTPPAEELLP